MSKLSSDVGDVRNFRYVPSNMSQLRLFSDLDKVYSIHALKGHLVRVCAGKVMTVNEVYETHCIDTPYTRKNFKDALLGLEAEERVVIDPPADRRQKRLGQVTLANDKIVTFPA